MRIFEVYEVEWSNRYINGPSWGVFTNFTAADNFVRTCFTPEYDRHLVIVETEAHDVWPALGPWDFNKLVYYCQLNGQIALEIDDVVT